MAWDALDAVVLDRNSQILTLMAEPDDILANGTIIAVKGTQTPPGDWSWDTRGDYLVLDHHVYGPSAAEIDPRNYVPSYGLEPEESPAARQLVVIGGTLLLRPRTAIGAVAMLSLLTIGLSFIGHHHEQAKEVYHVAVQIRPGQRLQADNWGYMRSWREPVQAPQRAGSLLYPMLVSESQIQSLQLELRCASNGAPEVINATLPPHNTLAWLRRAVRGNLPQPELKPAANTPFTTLLNEKYISPRLQHVGDELHSGDPILRPK
jgi:hypothetical protein